LVFCRLIPRLSPPVQNLLSQAPNLYLPDFRLMISIQLAPDFLRSPQLLQLAVTGTYLNSASLRQPHLPCAFRSFDRFHL